MSSQEIDLWSHHLHVPLNQAKAPQKWSEASLQGRGVAVYFCDWYPKLFGIDEDEIPSSEDEEGRFDIPGGDAEGGESLETQAKALTKEQLDRMRVGFYNCMTDDELREAWMREQKPQYGRRARPKVILKRGDGEEFECICDIDYHYCRHYIPKFGGGVAKEGEELKIPHFKTFWEDFKEKPDMKDLEGVPQILEPEVAQSQKKVFHRPFPRFPGPAKKSVRNFRQQLLSAFRPLQCKEIRRYRMPYVEALYLELQEEDCLNGAAFFKYLIIKDYFVHKAPNKSAPSSLQKNKKIATKIFEILKLAEKFSKREENHKEAYVYLNTGRYFFRLDREYWWLTEEFYTKAVKVSQNYVIDGGKSEAISNYIFGTFLLDCVDSVQSAQEHLLRARELSQGKEWSARNILNQPQDSVYKESAIYLCRALIATSKELRKQDKPEEALPLIHRSHKLCEGLESWRLDIIMETYFELGMTYKAVGMFDWAKVAFSKFIEFAEMENYVKGICDGYLELAICFRSEGDLFRCERNLTSFRNVAKHRENENLIAFGDRYLGEFYLNKGDSSLALELLTKAFNSFLSQFHDCSKIPFSEWQPEHFTLPNDVELTRVLTGLAKGEIFTKTICSLLLEAESSHEKILKLIEWKNNPDKFTLEDLQDQSETPSIQPEENVSEEFVLE